MVLYINPYALSGNSWINKVEFTPNLWNHLITNLKLKLRKEIKTNERSDSMKEFRFYIIIETIFTIQF
ncbi:hypothetical protein H311_01604 [Anncaliia algerae PRA109]|nr:hypothetical protein H311_01604 [Anncaliia algerae PRA109]